MKSTLQREKRSNSIIDVLRSNITWLFIKQRKEPLLIKGLFLYIVSMNEDIKKYEG